MKKSLLLMGLAVAAFTACTNEETIEVADSRMLSFNGAFVGNATKAVTDVTTDNIKEFYVYGRKNNSAIFDGEKVYESGTEGTWIYDNLQMWEASQTWNFAAYSDGGVATASTTATVNWDGSALTITDYNTNVQKDLVVSIASNADDLASSNVPVEFNFEHALSMIKFTIQSELGDDANAITISEFTVTGANGQGNLTYNGTATWDDLDTPATLSNAAEFTTESSAAGESDPFVVIPQTATLTVKFTATLNNGEGVNVTKKLQATITDATWQPGLKYNYIATITGANMDIITFAEPTVTAWDETNWTTGSATDNEGALTEQN